MPNRNIRLDIQYDGTEYSGWQVQKNAVTVQWEIEKAIYDVTGQKVSLYAAGRTDAGVHALGQVANFRVDHDLAPEKYKDAVNFYLPNNILITDSSEVDDDFHARKSAKWRQYRYLIGLQRSALYFNRRWECVYDLNLDRMNQIADYIRGVHDFSAFCVVSSQKENNECDILVSEWRKEESQLRFEIRANRFLHSMVRSLVGCMVDAGREKDFLTIAIFDNILKSGDHTRIKTVAPARGLYLVAAGY
ncbi:MAG: tRNA pseudouridine(38-40) synthase TruA [Candidatus Zixiibacteriota bacterium]|nr:MAG: tRNA pseudouridine(38-40) synthase TruA [candidate division Zixibacteria bacterium]